MMSHAKFGSHHLLRLSPMFFLVFRWLWIHRWRSQSTCGGILMKLDHIWGWVTVMPNQCQVDKSLQRVQWIIIKFYHMYQFSSRHYQRYLGHLRATGLTVLVPTRPEHRAPLWISSWTVERARWSHEIGWGQNSRIKWLQQHVLKLFSPWQCMKMRCHAGYVHSFKQNSIAIMQHSSKLININQH